jgi:hypothetical protein
MNIKETTTVYTNVALFEKGNGVVRGILFDIDLETGAKSVRDIVEVEQDEKAAASFMQIFGTEWLFDGRQIASFNAGRAHTQLGLLKKLIASL